MQSFFLAVAFFVAAAPSPDLDRQVRELVARLDADTQAERDSAEQALIQLGPTALEHLPEITSRTPAETVKRLMGIRFKLEKAQNAAAAETTRVTLIGEDLPLADVIARISQQTDNKIVDYRQEFGEEVTEPRLNLHLDGVAFWKAVDRVLDQADLTLYDFTGQRGIFLVNRPPNVVSRGDRVAYSGPFRIQATRFEALRELRTASGASLRLFMNVAWEPRLMPFAIRQPLDKITAQGTGGVAVAVTGGDGEPEASVSDNSSSVEMQIPLQLPPRSVAAITSLKGELLVKVPGPIQTFRFDRLPIIGEGFAANAEKVEQRQGSATVTVDRVSRNNDLWEVRMRVRFDNPGDALESHRSWVSDHNTMYLQGPDREKILPGGYEQTRQTENEAGFAYLFDLPDGPKGLSFVYCTPTAVFELPVKYELHDLPLP